MDFKELEVFLHLSQSLHFARTAEDLHMSPSTLSRTIQRLEADLNQTLFERDNRSVKLTPSGLKLVEFAHSVLQQLSSLNSELVQQNKSISGELTLFCTVTAAVIYAPKLLEAFKDLYPAAEIKLATGDVSLAFEKIEKKSVDFAYAVLPKKLPDQYEFHSIESIDFKFIGPAMGTDFSQYMDKPTPDWEQLPFVIPDAGPVRERILDWFKQMKIKPNIYAQVSGHEAIVSMTALGCGVSAIPAPVLEHSPLNNKIKILSASIPPLPLNLGICTLKKNLKRPINNAFWELLKNVYRAE